MPHAASRPEPSSVRRSAAQPLVAPHGEGEEDRENEERPDHRHQQRVLQDPGICAPAGVAEQLAGSGDGGRERVPFGDRAEPAWHGLGPHERVGEEEYGPHQDLNRHHRLRALDDEAQENPDPQQREAQPQQQRQREQRLAHRTVPPPADHEPADNHDRQTEGGVEHVGDAAAEYDRGGRHRHGAEAVGHPFGRVVGYGGHGPLQAEHHGHGEHPRHEELAVVPATQRRRPAQQVAEHQEHHNREQQPDDDHEGLSVPVDDVAAGDGPGVGQRPAQPVRGGSRYAWVRSTHAASSFSAALARCPVRRRNTSSSVGPRSPTSSARRPAPSTPRITSVRPATRSPTGALIRRAAASISGSVPLTRPTMLAATGSSSALRTTTSTRSPPILDLSPSGVPSAMALPWSITAILSANWSASSRYWVVRSTVVPPATSERTACHTSLRPRGSSPVVGSSRNMTC